MLDLLAFGGQDLLEDGLHAKTVSGIERMSIVVALAAAAPAVITPTTLPTTLPATTFPAEIAPSLRAAATLIGFSLLVMAVTGVFRRRSIAGPPRLPSQKPLMPLLVVTLIGGAAWIGGQIAFALVFIRRHPGMPFSPENLTPRDLAMVSVFPPAAGLLILAAFDTAGGLVRPIGYNPSRLPIGLLKGVIAAIAILPLVYGSSIVLELLYRAIRFQHPSEHELLGAMKEAPADVRRLLIIGACIAAPVFEEMLFRGHIQTVLVRLFTPRPRELPPIIPLAGTPDPAIQPIAIQCASPDTSSPRPSAWLTWAAVLATAFLFALVHPGWMRPLIFLLAVGLGYAYERTGSLWVAIVVHAAFNTTSTVWFLYGT
jgi:hypothetical protein